eukprot:TRINITY_DN13538_c0_g1_i1.p1 TRINITY_DN13538_c0_g1~~TRINITY_DN13538_c0_g1_i1.p1  ORF type:complete len:363 (-),score=62.01 TRINITY_DN13538_c0_g1_i1:63-1151(-)
MTTSLIDISLDSAEAQVDALLAAAGLVKPASATATYGSSQFDDGRPALPPRRPVSANLPAMYQSPAPTPTKTTLAAPALTPSMPSADGSFISIPGQEAWEIASNELMFIDKIAEGGFGEVYKATWRGKTVAVKTVKAQVLRNDPRCMKNFTTEISVMARTRHPNIAMFLGACLRPPELGIVLEFLPRGSVFDWLHSRAQVTWELIRRFAIDTALAMNYLHLCKPPIIHRDLKSANLLIADDWTVKLSDFGLSRLLDTQQHMTRVGTTAWTAPEVLSNQRYDIKADVFSFGIVLWELVTRHVPYAGMDPVQVALAVVNQNMRPPIPSTCPPAMSQLMQRCWQTTPEYRPSFNEVLTALQSMPV